jgi:hypothetical protein
MRVSNKSLVVQDPSMPGNNMCENRETSALPVRSKNRPVREGKSRKTDVNGVEESDSGIVPANGLNKDASKHLRRAGREGR